MPSLLIIFVYAALALAYLCTATALLTPRENYVCPHETVTITCVIPRQQSNFLQWNVNFMHQSITRVERTFIAGLDRPELTRNDTNNVGQLVTFRLNSVSPLLNSTMIVTIKDSPEFRQLWVKCGNGSAITGESDMSTIFVITEGMLNSQYL